jgi:hypothetical protein
MNANQRWNATVWQWLTHANSILPRTNRVIDEGMHTPLNLDGQINPVYRVMSNNPRPDHVPKGDGNELNVHPHLARGDHVELTSTVEVNVTNKRTVLLRRMNRMRSCANCPKATELDTLLASTGPSQSGHLPYPIDVTNET